MLSSDKNIETIAQLVELVRHYLGLQKEYLKLDVIDKFVRLVTAITLLVIFFLFLVPVAMYFSFGIAYWLADFIGYTAAFFTVGFVHFLILLLFLTFRKSLIQRPLVRFLTILLMS